jgi:hypothetical protein
VETTAEIVDDYEGLYSATGTHVLPGAAEATDTLTGIGTGFTATVDLGIWRVEVTNPGILYGSADAVIFTPSGAGTDADADATVIPGFPELTMTGSATGLFLTNSHSDYWSGIVEGSIYEGKYAERYTITVTKAGVGQKSL